MPPPPPPIGFSSFGSSATIASVVSIRLATEAAFENPHEALRIHGGYGYSTEFMVERLYWGAPLLCIGEGTNEMQRMIIARQIIQRNKI